MSSACVIDHIGYRFVADRQSRSISVAYRIAASQLLVLSVNDYFGFTPQAAKSRDRQLPAEQSGHTVHFSSLRQLTGALPTDIQQ